MVKHTQTIRRQEPKNCLSVLDHFVGLVLKGLSHRALFEVIPSIVKLNSSMFTSLKKS